jgi:DNA-binding CsgD family transcriptional regulator
MFARSEDADSMTSMSAVHDCPLPDFGAGQATAPLADGPVDNGTPAGEPPTQTVPAHLTITLELHCEPVADRASASQTPAHWVTAAVAVERVPVAKLAGTLDADAGKIHLHGVIPERWVPGIHEWAESRTSGTPSVEEFGLTPRQWDVARLLARGISNADIAATLGISPHTARRHTERVLRKLEVNSRAQVAAKVRWEHQSPAVSHSHILGAARQMPQIRWPANQVAVSDDPQADPA